MMSNDISVTWVPSHPCSGSISLQRYWSELDHAANDLGYEVDCVLDHPRLNLPKVSRLSRALTLYAKYPLKVSRVKTPIVHMLSHGAQSVRHVRSGIKTVVTVHDIIPLVYSENLNTTQLERYRNWILTQVKSADVLVAISQSTKEHLISVLGVDSEKIKVVYNGFTTFAGREVRPPKASLTQENRSADGSCSILSVGSCLKRKNLDIFPDVLKRLRALGLFPVIHRVGPILPDPLRSEIISIIGADGLKEYGRVSDEVLRNLYIQCDMLFFPSRFEGFGLPLLEAMGQGCPVVSSDATSLPEVGGDSVLYFNPDSAEEAAHQVAKLLDHNIRNDLVVRGFEQVKQFSWKQCLLEYISIYNELLGC